MNISSRTRLFALLGDPVAHSLSPAIHNAAFQAAGIDAVYVALRCDADDVVATMQLLAGAGGGGNVTIPHKGAAATLAAAGSDAASIGAVNTFASTDGGLVVANTDVDGVTNAVATLGSFDSWLVIGTGGSARAVAAAAARTGARLACSSRDPGRGAAFTEWSRTLGAVGADPVDCDLVVNATPLGLHPDDAMPADPDALPAVRGALDLTYRQTGTTAWCRRWNERGVAALDGREPLLHQAIGSWQVWFPGVVPPVEVMRAVIRGQLG